MHDYDGEPGPLEVSLHVSASSIVAVIVDEGNGIPEEANPDDVHGVGLPLMRALSDQLEFRAGPRGGTEVRLEFAGRRGGAPLFAVPPEVAEEDGFAAGLSGDAVVSISPLTFVGPVLGRLARGGGAEASGDGARQPRAHVLLRHRRAVSLGRGAVRVGTSCNLAGRSGG